MLEKLVNIRLVKFLERSGVLSERQFGFRAHRSTEDAISLLVNVISSNLDNNINCIGVFLDLAKAFDTVSRPILLKKLEKMGIRGVSLAWFDSYLSERSQLVKVDCHSSGLDKVDFGVPQGSVLGPTLFLIYINDIHKISLPQAEIICYADDTVILFKGDTWESAFAAAEKGMSNAACWFRDNLLTLNSKKTKFLCFHKSAASSPTNSTNLIKIHNCNNVSNLACSCEVICRSNSIKYLGLVIDENLNFKSHITVSPIGLGKRCIYLRNFDIPRT